MAYVKITDFAAKDALISGNPLKLITGTGLGAEFDAIAAASALTVDLASVQTLVNKTLTAPVLTSPVLGTPASGVATNLTGTAAALNIGGNATTATTATTANALNVANNYTVNNLTVDFSGAISSIVFKYSGQTKVTYLGKSSSYAFNCYNSTDSLNLISCDYSGNFTANGNITATGGTVTATTFAGNATTATNLAATASAGNINLVTIPIIPSGGTSVSIFEGSAVSTPAVEIANCRVFSAGTYRVAFSAYDNVGFPGAIQIYKNGVALGTSRSPNSATYVNYTEDLAFAAGDTVQLFSTSYGGAQANFVKNFGFRVSSTAGLVAPFLLAIGLR